jgi:regulator of sigma E protease
MEPFCKFRIGKITKGTPAESGGLLEGDRILSIGGVPVHFYQEYKAVADSFAGNTVSLLIDRHEKNGKYIPIVKLQMPVTSEGAIIGFEPDLQIHYDSVNYSLSQAIPKGFSVAFSLLINNIKAFGKIFSGDINLLKSISGPIGIAKIFGNTWDWLRFWRLVGFLSMILAFMNFLPIPALDGGHVMFLTLEIVSGHKPPDKFMETAQKVGLVLLFTLMLFIIFNDIFKEVFLVNSECQHHFQLTELQSREEISKNRNEANEEKLIYSDGYQSEVSSICSSIFISSSSFMLGRYNSNSTLRLSCLSASVRSSTMGILLP